MTSSELALTPAEHARAAAVDALVALGAAGVGELIAAMSDPSWTVRRAVVAGLAALGDDAVPALIAWLREARTSEHAIAAAVDALVASIGPGAAAAVAALVDDPRPPVVADAAVILGRRRAVEHAGALAPLVEHADDNVAVAAMEALGAIGGGVAVDALVALVRRRSFFRAYPALQILARSSDPRAIAPIAELFGDPLFHDEAVRALGRTGSPLAIAPLAGALAAPGPDAARVVASALADALDRAAWTGADVTVAAAIRAAFGPARDRLITALAGGGPDERAALVRVLGCLGDGAALGPLVDLLDDTALRPVVTAAIDAIAGADADAVLAVLERGDTATRVALLPSIGATRAAPRLRALLADDDAEVRARAASALARIGDRLAVPALFAALGDPNPRVGHAAAAAIHALGTEATPGLALAALASPSAAVRRQALRIISSFGWPETFDAVRAAIADPDPRVAELAVTGLAVHEHPDVDDLLADLARSPAPSLRAAALRAAAQRSGDRVESLLAAGAGDPSPWVRYYACQGLGRFRRPASIPRLIQALADDQPHVRVAALEALAHFDSAAAWDALARAARSRDPDEQRAALVGIGQATAYPDGLAILLDAARESELATRLIALSGLARSSDPRALDELAAVALGPVGELADAALSLLAERSDPRAADVLVRAAIATDADHPAHATLSRPGAARVAAIADRLAVADARSAPVLVAALARMRTPDALAVLTGALGAASPAARRAAATTLLAIDAEGARAAVGRLAASDPDAEVRNAAGAALSSSA